MGGIDAKETRMNQAFQLLVLLSIWNLLILAAVWRISTRAVEHARRDAIIQTTSAYAARVAATPRKPRAKKDAAA